MRFVRRLVDLGTFFLIPALGALSPLLVLPSLTASYGSDGWTAIAIGQSIGAAGAVIAELGWGVVGPQAVARLQDRNGHRRLYRDAAATRLLALAVVAPACLVVTWFLAPTHKPAAALIAFGFSLAALSPSWYFTGLNRPTLILWAETLPKITAALTTVIWISLGGPLEAFGISIALAAIWTWAAGTHFAGAGLWPRRDSFRRGPQIMKEQYPVVLGRAVSVVYTALPISIVAAVNVQATSTFASTDRLMRMSLTILAGLPNRLQSWVGHPVAEIRRKRSGQSIAINVGFGVLSGSVFALLAPWASEIVFSGASTIDFTLAITGGAVLLCMVSSRGLGLSLVAGGLSRYFPRVNILAAATGIISIPILAVLWGPLGGVIGAGLAELVGIIAQAIILITKQTKSGDEI